MKKGTDETGSAVKLRGYNKGSVTGRLPEAAGDLRLQLVGEFPG